MSAGVVTSYFQWLKANFGFSDSKLKPYNFNPQPFLADKRSAMQGYVTSEPYAVEKAGGFKPKIFLLADHGFDSYSTLLETRRELVEKRPELVQRFVDASIIGWYNYLYLTFDLSLLSSFSRCPVRHSLRIRHVYGRNGR